MQIFMTEVCAWLGWNEKTTHNGVTSYILFKDIPHTNSVAGDT